MAPGASSRRFASRFGALAPDPGGRRRVGGVGGLDAQDAGQVGPALAAPVRALERVERLGRHRGRGSGRAWSRRACRGRAWSRRGSGRACSRRGGRRRDVPLQHALVGGDGLVGRGQARGLELGQPQAQLARLAGVGLEVGGQRQRRRELAPAAEGAEQVRHRPGRARVARLARQDQAVLRDGVVHAPQLLGVDARELQPVPDRRRRVAELGADLDEIGGQLAPAPGVPGRPPGLGGEPLGVGIEAEGGGERRVGVPRRAQRPVVDLRRRAQHAHALGAVAAELDALDEERDQLGPAALGAQAALGALQDLPRLGVAGLGRAQELEPGLGVVLGGARAGAGRRQGVVQRAQRLVQRAGVGHRRETELRLDDVGLELAPAGNEHEVRPAAQQAGQLLDEEQVRIARLEPDEDERPRARQRAQGLGGAHPGQAARLRGPEHQAVRRAGRAPEVPQEPSAVLDDGGPVAGGEDAHLAARLGARRRPQAVEAGGDNPAPGEARQRRDRVRRASADRVGVAQRLGEHRRRQPRAQVFDGGRAAPDGHQHLELRAPRLVLYPVGQAQRQLVPPRRARQLGAAQPRHEHDLAAPEALDERGRN